MLRKIVILLFIISMLILISGCWDSMDINEKNIATATAIGREGELFTFYAEIANLTAGTKGSSKAKKYFLIKSYGKTYIDARLDIDIKVDKKEYLGATQTMILTSDLTKHGIDEYMYRIRNLTEYRRTLDIVTTFNKVEDLFNIESQKNLSMGETIKQTLDTLIKNGQAIKYSSSEIMEWLTNDYSCFVLPSANIKNNEIAITGYTVLKKGIYSGYISIKESNGLLCFLNDQAKLTYNVPFGNKKIAIVEVQIKNRQIQPKYLDKEITFDASFTFDSQVQYLNINDGLDEDAVEEVKKNLTGMLLKDLKHAVVQSQEIYKGDFLDLYDVFRISYPSEIKKMDWSEKYLESKISISVETSLDPGGMYDYNPQKD